MWFRKASVIFAASLMGCTATGTGTDPTEATTATLMANATEITDADIPTPELEALIAAEVGDQLYAIPSSEGAIIYVRLRAEDTHRMYATLMRRPHRGRTPSRLDGDLPRTNSRRTTNHRRVLIQPSLAIAAAPQSTASRTGGRHPARGRCRSGTVGEICVIARIMLVGGGQRPEVAPIRIPLRVERPRTPQTVTEFDWTESNRTRPLRARTAARITGIRLATYSMYVGVPTDMRSRTTVSQTFERLAAQAAPTAAAGRSTDIDPTRSFASALTSGRATIAIAKPRNAQARQVATMILFAMAVASRLDSLDSG